MPIWNLQEKAAETITLTKTESLAFQNKREANNLPVGNPRLDMSLNNFRVFWLGSAREVGDKQ